MYKSNNKSLRKTSNRENGIRKISKRKIVDIILIVLFVFAVVYIGSVVHKVTATVTEIEALPQDLLRVQLIAPCSQKQLLKKTVNYFEDIKNNDFEIKVVDTSCSDLKGIKSTMIISREENNNHAALLADYFQIEEDKILYKKLENNKNQVSVTLVLGNDIENYITIFQNKES